MTEQLMNAATVFLMIFGLVAAVDGLYLHLWKYKLYARPESRRAPRANDSLQGQAVHHNR